MMMRPETPTQRLERARQFWPDIEPMDLIVIDPIGARGDTLLFYRSKGRVSTGMKGSNMACFEDDLTAFRNRVIADYSRRINEATSETLREQLTRHRADYLAACNFFKALTESP